MYNLLINILQINIMVNVMYIIGLLHIHVQFDCRHNLATATSVVPDQSAHPGSLIRSTLTGLLRSLIDSLYAYSYYNLNTVMLNARIALCVIVQSDEDIQCTLFVI